MAYIEIIPPEKAEGALKVEYGKAAAGGGWVWSIVRMMSPNPRVLRASMDLYRETMIAPSPLSRAQREMLAVTVSKANDCHY